MSWTFHWLNVQLSKTCDRQYVDLRRRKLSIQKNQWKHLFFLVYEFYEYLLITLERLWTWCFYIWNSQYHCVRTRSISWSLTQMTPNNGNKKKYGRPIKISSVYYVNHFSFLSYFSSSSFSSSSSYYSSYSSSLIIDNGIKNSSRIIL